MNCQSSEMCIWPYSPTYQRLTNIVTPNYLYSSVDYGLICIKANVEPYLKERTKCNCSSKHWTGVTQFSITCNKLMTFEKNDILLLPTKKKEMNKHDWELTPVWFDLIRARMVPFSKKISFEFFSSFGENRIFISAANYFRLSTEVSDFFNPKGASTQNPVEP